MIGEGDRILVGLSGGKDSFMLLHALHALRRKAPVRFDLIAATFDPGFPEFNVAGIADYCRRQGWEHRVVKLDIAGILAEKRYEGTPCVLCSRLRRGKLYGLAAAEGCGKLALGQHFDDIAASFLMSLFRGQGLSTMGPNVAAKAKEGIRIIRPFVLAPESLIVRCREERELPQAGKCRYEAELADGDRAYFRGLVDELAERIPNLRSQDAAFPEQYPARLSARPRLPETGRPGLSLLPPDRFSVPAVRLSQHRPDQFGDMRVVIVIREQFRIHAAREGHDRQRGMGVGGPADSGFRRQNPGRRDGERFIAAAAQLALRRRMQRRFERLVQLVFLLVRKNERPGSVEPQSEPFGDEPPHPFRCQDIPLLQFPELVRKRLKRHFLGFQEPVAGCRTAGCAGRA